MVEATETTLEKLVPDPFGLRVHYDDKVVMNLAGSILQSGIITPLLVRPKEDRYEIIDGNYRYRALEHIKWEKPIPINSEEMTDEEALLRATVANWHRRNFYFGDKSNAIQKLEEQAFSEEKICMRLEIKPPTLRAYKSFQKHVDREAKEILFPREQTISKRHAGALVKLKDRPELQLKLAEKIVTEGLDGAEAEREAKKMMKPPKPERLTLPDFLKKVNPIFYEFGVWEVPEKRPQGGMVDFKGNCSPYVCAGCLYNYAREGDVVMDPMAGSGTFLDVANEVKTSEGKPAFRDIICSDLHPVRPDIKPSDAEKIDLPNESVDFIFVHFPYWNSINFVEEAKKRGAKQIDEQAELSRLPLEEFEKKSKAILHKLHNILKTGRNLCLMIGPKRSNEGFLDLPLLFEIWACEDKDAKFALEDRVIVMTYNPRKISFKAQGKRRLAIGRGRKNNHLNINYDEILVLKK